MAGRIAVDYAEANLGGVPEAIAGPTVYDPVSYTHLDVYKRQVN